MKRKLVSAILALVIVLSCGATASAGWKDVYDSVDDAEISEGQQYLDELETNIVYPEKSDYLSEFITKYVKPSDDKEKVYALHGLTDGSKWKELAVKVEKGTQVTVIAEHSYKSDGVKYTYSCCIFEKNGTTYAGWINNHYLTTDSKDFDAKNKISPFEADLDDVGTDIVYPENTDYLDDYKIKYVKSTVYALHGLDDGAKWKDLATKVPKGTKVIIIAEHSFKSNGVKSTYSCCIFEKNGTAYAGWINNDYLVLNYK